MAQKQYNSPMQMYSEDALEEIMTEGTLGLVIFDQALNQFSLVILFQILNYLLLFRGKPFNPENAMNPTGQEFDKAQSSVLSFIMGDESMSLESNKKVVVSDAGE